MDYFDSGNIDEKNMSEEYREAEALYRKQAARLWDLNEELKKETRARIDDEPEERLDHYRQRYEQGIEREFQKGASEFISGIAGPLGKDRRLLQESVGASFANHVIALAPRSTEELERVMQTAQRTGEEDLARAVAQVALDRQHYGLFERWASSEPELAAAMRRIRSTPGPEQLAVRTNAMKPPKAAPESLQPAAEDFERAESVKTSQEAARARFFNLPRRQVGSRVVS